MRSGRVFLATAAAACTLLSLGAASAAAAPPAAAGPASASANAAGPPTFVLDLFATLPTPVCNPSWGSVVIPICV